MNNIGKKLRSFVAWRVGFMCPACKELHHVTVQGGGPNVGPVWGYNGNADAPTFTPSILVRGVQAAKDEKGRWTGDFVCGPDGEPLPMVCHSFVTDGRIQFLGDCTHALAGQTVDLPDLQGDEGDV